MDITDYGRSLGYSFELDPAIKAFSDKRAREYMSLVQQWDALPPEPEKNIYGQYVNSIGETLSLSSGVDSDGVFRDPIADINKRKDIETKMQNLPEFEFDPNKKYSLFDYQALSAAHGGSGTLDLGVGEGHKVSAPQPAYAKQYGAQLGDMLDEGIRTGVFSDNPDWLDKYVAPGILAVATAINPAFGAIATGLKTQAETDSWGAGLKSAGTSYLAGSIAQGASGLMSPVTDSMVNAGLSTAAAEGVTNTLAATGTNAVKQYATTGSIDPTQLAISAVPSIIKGVSSAFDPTLGGDSTYATDYKYSDLPYTYSGPDTPLSYGGFDSSGEYIGSAGAYNSLGQFTGGDIAAANAFTYGSDGQTHLLDNSNIDLVGSGSQYPLDTRVPLSLNPIDENGMAHTGLQVDPQFYPDFTDAYQPVVLDAQLQAPYLDYTEPYVGPNPLKIKLPSGGSGGGSQPGGSPPRLTFNTNSFTPTDSPWGYDYGRNGDVIGKTAEQRALEQGVSQQPMGIPDVWGAEPDLKAKNNFGINWYNYA